MSVAATCCLVPSINNSFKLASEFSAALIPPALYFVNEYCV